MNDRKARRRRRSRNGFVDILNGLLTLLVLGLLVAGGVLLYGATQFYTEGPLDRGHQLPRRRRLGPCARSPTRLEEQGLIPTATSSSSAVAP